MPIDDEFKPYWILVSNERLPHLGAGLHHVYVVDTGKGPVRLKHRPSLIKARSVSRVRWDALPHYPDNGEGLCTIREALTAYGTISATHAGVSTGPACRVPFAGIKARRRKTR